MKESAHWCRPAGNKRVIPPKTTTAASTKGHHRRPRVVVLACLGRPFWSVGVGESREATIALYCPSEFVCACIDPTSAVLCELLGIVRQPPLLRSTTRG